MWSCIFFIVASCAWLNGVEAALCLRAAGGDYFKEELLIEDNNLQEATATDWTNNKLYILRKLKSQYEVLDWDLEKKSYTVLGRLPEYCWLTVDQRHGRVYAGCRNRTARGGLYIFDRHPQQFVPLTDRDGDIRWVHFADRLYYINYGELQLRSYGHGYTRPVADLRGIEMWHFAVDGHNGWLYTLDGHVYHRREGATSSVEVTPGVNIWSLAASPNGEVYGAGGQRGGIYRIDVDNDSVTKVLDTPGECYLTIDKDNNFICFIPDSQRSIIRWVWCKP